MIESSKKQYVWIIALVGAEELARLFRDITQRLEERNFGSKNQMRQGWIASVAMLDFD